MRGREALAELDAERRARAETAPPSGQGQGEIAAPGASQGTSFGAEGAPVAERAVSKEAPAVEQERGLAERERALQEREAEVSRREQELRQGPAGPAEAEPETSTVLADTAKYPVREVPVGDISLSKDVPQFKAGANASGVVEGEQLGGRYERLGTPPIVVWRRSNGDLEVITGRHRLDLARRTGEETIPAQVVREDDGFTPSMALTYDAAILILT